MYILDVFFSIRNNTTTSTTLYVRPAKCVAIILKLCGLIPNEWDVRLQYAGRKIALSASQKEYYYVIRMLPNLQEGRDHYNTERALKTKFKFKYTSFVLPNFRKSGSVWKSSIESILYYQFVLFQCHWRTRCSIKGDSCNMPLPSSRKRVSWDKHFFLLIQCFSTFFYEHNLLYTFLSSPYAV